MSFLKYVARILLLLLAFGIFGILYLAPPGGDDAPLYALEAMSCAAILLAVSLKPPELMRTAPRLLKVLTYVCLFISFMAAYSVVLHDGGAPFVITVLVAGIAGFAFSIRIDLIIQSMAEESLVDMHRRLLYGGVGFALFIGLGIVTNTSFLTVDPWALAFSAMWLIIGVMTVRSRLAVIANAIPDGASEKQYQSMAEFERMYPTQMEQQAYWHKIAVLDYEIRQAESMSRIYWFLFRVFYLVLAYISGLVVSALYLYKGVGRLAGRA